MCTYLREQLEYMRQVGAGMPMPRSATLDHRLVSPPQPTRSGRRVPYIWPPDNRFETPASSIKIARHANIIRSHLDHESVAMRIDGRAA